jgi:hypothetical protein
MSIAAYVCIVWGTFTSRYTTSFYAEDYKHHHTYIWENPVRAGLSERPELFAWSSASLGMELDAPPPGLKP